MVELQEHRPSEATSLLGTRPDAPVLDVSVEVDVLDELPLITRSNSFSPMSPNYAAAGVSASDRKIYLDATDEPEPHWRAELIKLLTLMGPLTLTFLLEYIPGMVCIVLVGHLDAPDTKPFVDAATLSSMFTNVTGLAVGFGLSSALDTLCSQAFGASRLDKIGTYLQAGFIVIGACLLPIFLLNWNTEYFLLLAGQDTEVARLAGEFSRITVFGIPFLFIYEMHRKVLQAQNIIKPLVAIMLLGNIVNVVGGYYLTYHTSLGFHGAALSRTLGYVILPFGLVPLFALNKESTKWWSGWHLQAAWQYIGLFLRLGVPGMLMMAMEWWAYEVLALMAGMLPDSVVAVSAQAVLMNVVSMFFMIFLGVSVSGNILVGNALGANQPRKAQLVSQLAMGVVLVVASIASLSLATFRFEIPALFINDPVAIQRAAETLLTVVPYLLLDSSNSVIQGIFRGTGRQHIAAKANAVAFYVVGIPLAALLAFPLQMNVEGLWLGFGAGISTALIVCSYVLYRSSWTQMATEAQARMAH